MTATARPPDPTTDGQPPDAEPIDVGTIRATVDQALEQGPLPRYEDLVELEALLRGHIGLLLPLGEAAAGQLWRGGVEWYGQRSFLTTARDRMGQGLGAGLSSARAQVRQLAHDCRALLKYAPTGSGR